MIACRRKRFNSFVSVIIALAVDRADEVLAEGRDRVMDLRSISSSTNNFTGELEKIADEQSQRSPTVFRMVTHGMVRELDAVIGDEMFWITREALINAYRHANATKILVEVTYTSDEFRVRVVDDGRGIDEKIIVMGRPDHWGLSGMRERAEHINAMLKLSSRLGRGVEVDIRVAASAVYRRNKKRSL